MAPVSSAMSYKNLQKDPLSSLISSLSGSIFKGLLHGLENTSACFVDFGHVSIYSACLILKDTLNVCDLRVVG